MTQPPKKSTFSKAEPGLICEVIDGSFGLSIPADRKCFFHNTQIMGEHVTQNFCIELMPWEHRRLQRLLGTEREPLKRPILTATNAWGRTVMMAPPNREIDLVTELHGKPISQYLTVEILTQAERNRIHLARSSASLAWFSRTPAAEQ